MFSDADGALQSDVSQACFQLAYLAYTSTLKMEAVRSSEFSVHFYQTARRHIPEDDNVRSILVLNQRCPSLLLLEFDTNELVKYFEV
jgi:vesicle coat complex subunit